MTLLSKARLEEIRGYWWGIKGDAEVTELFAHIDALMEEREADICPACASEYMPGTFKSVGTSICQDRNRLAERVEKLRDALLCGTTKGGVFWREDALKADDELAKGKSHD